MKRALRALAAAGILAAGTITAFVVAGPASADTQICQQYGSTTIGGRYVVMNNRWGTTAEQCINVTSTGFEITSQRGTGNTSGAPVSYPAIYAGCHYTNCSPGTNLPAQVGSISSIPSSITYRYVSGATYDAAYDIWLDPTPKKDGVNQVEIMIWFNRQGQIQPIGSRTATATIGGRTWEVWTGNNGGNDVVSYVAPSAISSWSFNVLDFINDTKNRSRVTNSWYLTSMQAGFEPWIGGAGLAVTQFSAQVNTGGSNPGNPTTPPVTNNPNPPAGGCTVAYTTNNWNSGFTAEVKVTNGGSGTLSNWALGFTLPGGQAITSAWNASISPSSGAVTARGVSYNSSIPAGGSASFGFQGTFSGSFAKPSNFTVNGTACRS